MFMSRYKLANVLVSSTETFHNNPLLCVRCGGDKSVVNSDVMDSDVLLSGPGYFDFTTYFGSLSTKKWSEYSTASNYCLHIELKGAACRITQTGASSFDWTPVLLDETTREVEESEEWQSIDMLLLPRSIDVINAFRIETDGQVLARNAYYYTEISETELIPVELALVTTTFRKESFVKNNINLVRQGILDSDEPIADHFYMHVIDNGRTLDAEELSSDRIIVHPNPNVGGSGGFARGMIEAMEQTPKATHVLLMDDDVEVLPESFIRTFNLLSILKEEYREAFISGAMMSLEEPDLRTEDLGFFTFEGNFRPLKPAGRMSSLHDVVVSEVFEPDTADSRSADTSQQYAGWWYCVIPMTTIEREGLPLPLFVRSDDAEYALRCKPKFITMNGICVWHASFFFKYSAAVERYQVSRNPLICQFTTGMAPLTDFTREIFKEVQLDLKKFNYDDALLAVKGFEDFLRGPEFIREPVAESRFMEANREREKLVPLDDLYDEALELGVDLSRVTSEDVVRDYPRSAKERAKDLATFNGQRAFVEEGKRGGKVAIIDAAGWVYPAGKIRGAEILIAIDMPNQKGAIRHLDKKRFDEVWNRYKKARKYFKKNKDRLRREYSAARDELTSVAFWKDYLRKAGEK